MPGDVAHELLDEVLLAAGELLDNAARFCHGTIRVRVEAHRDTISVEVSDDNLKLAEPRQPGPLDASGRGLRIVGAVARRWGQRRNEDGTKTIWYVIALPDGSALGHGCTLPAA